MDSLKEDDSAAKPPLKGISRGGPSILYFVGNIPQDAEKLKFEVISHFQKRKRFKGGEIVEKEYQVVGPYSALLLFENAEGEWMYVCDAFGNFMWCQNLQCSPRCFQSEDPIERFHV